MQKAQRLLSFLHLNNNFIEKESLYRLFIVEKSIM
jgi:hypothetical protein